MALKLVCDICGREVAVDNGDFEPQAYAVAVGTTVHGWLAIWVPRYELPGITERKKLKGVVGPLAGDVTVCSIPCAERALAQVNKKQLEQLELKGG